MSGWTHNDHGALDGLADDDHSQYLNDSRHDAKDAADHGSGAATDGQVLTADGAGGAAWEDVAAGNAAYSESIGDGSATSFAVAHNLGTTDVVVQLWDQSGTDPVEATADASSIEATDANTVTVTFGSAPSTDQYRVVILADGGSGGGSLGYLLDPNLKPPDSAHGSDLEYQNHANGTTVATLGLTWLNQETKTAEVQGGRLVVAVPMAASQYGGVAVAAPSSGDFTVTVRHRSWPVQNWHGIGLLAVDDDPAGTYITYRYQTRWLADNNAYFTEVDSGWGHAGNKIAVNHLLLLGGFAYERLVWTGSSTGTLEWQLTADPLAGWMSQWTSGTINRPTYVGHGLSGESSSSRDLYGSFDFLRFDWTPDFDPTT